MLKKRNLLFLSLLILGILLLSSCFLKPPVTEGILKGQVIVPEGFTQAKDLTGQALSDATVNIIDPATGAIIATTTTDANGYYQVFVPAGGPYLLEATKDGVKVQQFTPQVEAGIEYDLGTADCDTTSVALIAQAMMDAEDYPNDLADINLTDIETDPNFNDVMSDVCSIIEAGGDPTESAVVQQAVEDFLYPPTPTPPTPPPTPTYTVIYNGNGNTGGSVPTDGSSPYDYGVTVTVLTNSGTLVTTGYTFTGWNTQADGNGTDQAVGSDFTMGASNVTLYAKWTSADATISAGTLATVSLAGTFTGGANIAASSALTVTIPDASKINAALALTKGNANSTIKYVESASQPADGTAYTETYTSGSTTITVANDDVIWLLVTAEDTTTKLYYKITVTVIAPSSDATLKAESTVKGVTLTESGLGTPNAVIGSATEGTVTITGTKAADTTGLTPFITLFDPTDAGAAVNRVVKYATGVDPTTTFETDTAYDDEAITTLDFFIIKVTAEDTTTILYYKVVVTATRGIGDPYQGGIVAYILQDNGDEPDDPGYDPDVQHGLIAAAIPDQSTGIIWAKAAYQSAEIGVTAQGTAIGTGLANTNAIIAQNDPTYTTLDDPVYTGDITYAAGLARAYRGGGYSDWFLPSKDELHKLYLNKVAIFAHVGSFYWSSSEGDDTNAWKQYFNTGDQWANAKSGYTRVRAVRAF